MYMVRIMELLENIAQKLGIRDALTCDDDLVAHVEKRLPASAISSLVSRGLLDNEVYSIIIPRRTLQHRRARKERLSREESDRAVRVARIVALAENIFGDAQAAMRWLRTPKKRFETHTPMEMMATEAGSRLVEEMLYQIDEGIAA